MSSEIFDTYLTITTWLLVLVQWVCYGLPLTSSSSTPVPLLMNCCSRGGCPIHADLFERLRALYCSPKRNLHLYNQSITIYIYMLPLFLFALLRRTSAPFLFLQAGTSLVSCVWKMASTSYEILASLSKIKKLANWMPSKSRLMARDLAPLSKVSWLHATLQGDANLVTRDVRITPSRRR